MSYFVFLEFTDARIRTFLTNLRDALQQRPTRKPVHITVRGPYESPPDSKRLSELRQAVRGLGVRIFGVGAFSSQTEHIVYLRAESTMFRRIWWKSDFPIGSHGMHPHVTIYESNAKAAATAVQKFLRAERIEVFTRDVELTVYQTRQGDLFDWRLSGNTSRARGLDHLSVTKPGLLTRARQLGERLTSDPPTD